MRLTRIHQVGANATNFEETKAFYADVLGARYIAEFQPPGLLFFDFAGTRIVFERNDFPAILYFWVDDLEQAHSTFAQKGVKFDSEPHLVHRDDEGIFDNPGTEEWMALFKDPGGNTIALATRR
jgi:methylmalonyl-CoA/ethylmalonyl-CoA epimerase